MRRAKVGTDEAPGEPVRVMLSRPHTLDATGHKLASSSSHGRHFHFISFNTPLHPETNRTLHQPDSSFNRDPQYRRFSGHTHPERAPHERLDQASAQKNTTAQRFSH